MKRITKGTLKSFVSKNSGRLYIKEKSTFDGMVDCVMPSVNQAFRKIPANDGVVGYQDNTLGINGVWLVGSSRDYFTAFNADGFKGIEVSNCCGSFILAVEA